MSFLINGATIEDYWLYMPLEFGEIVTEPLYRVFRQVFMILWTTWQLPYSAQTSNVVLDKLFNYKF